MRILICSLAFLLTGWAHIRAGDGPDDPELHWTRGYQIPIHTHSGGYDGLGFNEVRGAVEAALDTWSDAGITVSFRRDERDAWVWVHWMDVLGESGDNAHYRARH